MRPFAEPRPPGGTGEFTTPGDERSELKITTDSNSKPVTPVDTLEKAKQPIEGSSFDPQRSQLIDSATTDTAEVFANPDGSKTVEVSADRVRYRDGAGRWQPIDTSLTPVTDGFAPAARDEGVLIPNDPQRAALEWHVAAGTFTLSVPDVVDKSGEPTVEKNRAVWTSGDLEARIEIGPSSFAQELVLKAADGPNSYLLTFALPEGVSARQAEAGVEFVDAEGAVVASFGGGVASDAAADKQATAPGQTPVVTTLVERAKTSAVVKVEIDRAWLDDSKRVFPVVIDPYVVTRNAISDTYVDDSLPTTSHDQEQYFYEGRLYRRSRSLLKFGLSEPVKPSNVVTEAHLRAYVSGCAYCAATPSAVALYGSGAAWPANVTWNTQPPTDGQAARSVTAWSGTATGWVNLDATSLVQDWLRGTRPNYGLYLLGDESGTYITERSFYSTETGYGYSPTLVYTWSGTADPPSLLTPADQATVTTTTPTLQLAGYGLKNRFLVGTSPDILTGNTVFDSGSVDAGSVQVPWGALRDGGKYWWTAISTGGAGTGVAPPTRSFTVNLRLGSGSVSPSDSVGPATVNLATGNLAFRRRRRRSQRLVVTSG